MNKFEEKLKDLKETFRNEVLAGNIEHEFEPSVCYGYIGKMTFKFDDQLDEVSISIAPNFICYHNVFIKDAFRPEDLPVLKNMIEFKKNEIRQKRIKELEEELKTLKEAV